MAMRPEVTLKTAFEILCEILRSEKVKGAFKSQGIDVDALVNDSYPLPTTDKVDVPGEITDKHEKLVSALFKNPVFITDLNSPDMREKLSDEQNHAIDAAYVVWDVIWDRIQAKQRNQKSRHDSQSDIALRPTTIKTTDAEPHRTERTQETRGEPEVAGPRLEAAPPPLTFSGQRPTHTQSGMTLDSAETLTSTVKIESDSHKTSGTDFKHP